MRFRPLRTRAPVRALPSEAKDSKLNKAPATSAKARQAASGFVWRTDVDSVIAAPVSISLPAAMLTNVFPGIDVGSSITTLSAGTLTDTHLRNDVDFVIAALVSADWPAATAAKTPSKTVRSYCRRQGRMKHRARLMFRNLLALELDFPAMNPILSAVLGNEES